jgi:hypothetical protein
MDTPQDGISPGHTNFQYLQPFGFPVPSSPHHLPLWDPSSPIPQRYDEEPSSSFPQITLPSAELESLSLKRNHCPLCKGKKYGFTSYFHNRSIFPSPPHEILALVEESYLLKDRLKSLLVTYAMRDVPPGNLPTIKDEVNNWGHWVGVLTCDVMTAAAFPLRREPLDAVRAWREMMVWRLIQHVEGKERLEMPRGRLAELLLEFRMVWEGVWKGYVRDRGVARGDPHPFV